MKQLVSMLLTSTLVTFPGMALANPMLLSQQNKQENIEQKIQIAFPDFVVVSLKSGNMTTGNFIDLNNRSLIISYKGYTSGIPLTEIKSIEFKNKVLIPANETVICQQSNDQCRQVNFTQNQEQEPTIVENIPMTNLNLFQGAKTALLTIPDISEEETDNINYLSNNNINIINSLEIDESGELITLTLIPTKRK
ncbi:hypothetical protein [Crocosphaera chwakensis]|uniref:Uncharacterized protein n=1 Tax=Crocosphaera chwakensis CCY0110 TaxID=391612 RepID=A3IQU2_9CHRO|nr:hypothetical protein [Crocosphaera chwakensis]EAZ91147.1 hypothetical protein CY0110_12807 [Crocosphaera chwakensis CCY0110]